MAWQQGPRHFLIFTSISFRIFARLALRCIVELNSSSAVPHVNCGRHWLWRLPRACLLSARHFSITAPAPRPAVKSEASSTSLRHTPPAPQRTANDTRDQISTAPPLTSLRTLPRLSSTNARLCISPAHDPRRPRTRPRCRRSSTSRASSSSSPHLSSCSSPPSPCPTSPPSTLSASTSPTAARPWAPTRTRSPSSA